MNTPNGQGEEALKQRVCEAMEDLDPQEALKALRVSLFPLETMPEDNRTRAVDDLVSLNLPLNLAFINWTVLAGGTGTTGCQAGRTGEGGLSHGDETTRRLHRNDEESDLAECPTDQKRATAGEAHESRHGRSYCRSAGCLSSFCTMC